jgi:hypothetical protein
VFTLDANAGEHDLICLGRVTDASGLFVDAPARRIAPWPSESINACKQAVYTCISLPIENALCEVPALAGDKPDAGC